MKLWMMAPTLALAGMITLGSVAGAQAPQGQAGPGAQAPQGHSLVQGQAPQGQGAPQGQRGPRGERGGDLIADLATVLGVSAEEIHEARRAGSSLAEIIVAQGSTVEAASAELVAAKDAALAARVAAGEISEAQKAEILARYEAKVTQCLSGAGGPAGPRGPQGGSGQGTFQAPPQGAPQGQQATTGRFGFFSALVNFFR